MPFQTAWPLLVVLASPPSPCDVSIEPPGVPDLESSVAYRSGSLYDWAGGRDNAPLGVGYLKLHTRDDWDWWRNIAIPLYDEPGVEHGGFWFVNGWLANASHELRETIPIGVSGLVETGYETLSFVVLQNRDDGWVRFRYGKPAGRRDGLAWTHTCHIEAEGLRFETWEDRFMSGEISPLTFRSAVPHALRAGPAESSGRLLWIAGDHHLEPIEFQDDWMRVRVKQPSDYCHDIEVTVAVAEHVGWVRWRSPDKGPWVWYFTRGC